MERKEVAKHIVMHRHVELERRIPTGTQFTTVAIPIDVSARESSAFRWRGDDWTVVRRYQTPWPRAMS